LPNNTTNHAHVSFMWYYVFHFYIFDLTLHLSTTFLWNTKPNSDYFDANLFSSLFQCMELSTHFLFTGKFIETRESRQTQQIFEGDNVFCSHMWMSTNLWKLSRSLHASDNCKWFSLLLPLYVSLNFLLFIGQLIYLLSLTDMQLSTWYFVLHSLQL
jgi:hypothetical protein